MTHNLRVSWRVGKKNKFFISVLAAYISFNISASHLLSASVMSAPAALAAAKLLYPGKKDRLHASIIKTPKRQKILTTIIRDSINHVNWH